MGKNGKFDLNDFNKNDFKSTFTRVEYEMSYDGSYDYIESFTSNDINDKQMFKKKFIADWYNLSSSTTVNYNGKPVLLLMGMSPNWDGITKKTGVLTSLDFATMASILFENNFEKAIEFYNKKFLSALRLQINKKSNIIIEAEKLYNDNDTSALVKMLNNDISDLYEVDTNEVFYVLDYIEDKVKVVKKGEINTSDLIKGIELYINASIEEFHKDNETDIEAIDLSHRDDESIFRYRIPKKSNPIKVLIGLNRENFTNSRYSIMSNSFFNIYKKSRDFILSLSKEFESISKEVSNNISDHHDSKVFLIDVTKVDLNDGSKLSNKLNSHKAISKFNL